MAAQWPHGQLQRKGIHIEQNYLVRTYWSWMAEKLTHVVVGLEV